MVAGGKLTTDGKGSIVSDDVKQSLEDDGSQEERALITRQLTKTLLDVQIVSCRISTSS